MAGLGHVAIGLAVGRVRAGTKRVVPAMLCYVSLAMLPDADVVGFRLGIPYASTWGHRGAFHSLLIAVLVGFAIGLVQKLRRVPAFNSALAGTLVVASHGLLDALTDGGLGVALFWPFTSERYFFPWHPIAVSPIGRALFFWARTSRGAD